MAKPGQHGLSLIEVMISTLMSVVIITAVTSVFLSNNQSNLLNRQLGLMQESARFAINEISRDLSLAGYTGCINQAAIGNALESTMTIFDWLANEHKVQGLTAAAATTTIDGASLSESLTIFKLNPELTFEVTGHNLSSNSLTLDTDVSALLATEQPVGLIRQDCSQVALISLSSVGTTTVSYATGSGTELQNCTTQLKGDFRCYDASTPTGNTSFNPGFISPVDSVVYYIRLENGLPTLVRKDIQDQNGIPVVDGIEDMRIYYGLDTNGDGAVNQYINAGDRAYRHLDWHEVTSARIHILARSENPVVPADIAPVDYFFDGANITPPPAASGEPDRFLRREFTMTVALRN